MRPKWAKNQTRSNLETLINGDVESDAALCHVLDTYTRTASQRSRRKHVVLEALLGPDCLSMQGPGAVGKIQASAEQEEAWHWA